MEFRLIYDGVLMGASRNNPRSEHKHNIRRVFHSQLKRLWNSTPHLKEWVSREVRDPVAGTTAEFSQLEHIANLYSLGKYRFAPLATKLSELACSVDVLFLRYDQPGQTLLQSGDIDNRLKTLFDALRMPQRGEYMDDPRDGENPFFCLLEDDSLITRLTLSTDLLLVPDCDVNDVRLVLTVKLWPIAVNFGNLGFGY